MSLKSTLAAMLALVATAGDAPGQELPRWVPGLHGDLVHFSGEVGTYGEIYRISGQENRRPAATGRLYFRPTISFFESFSISGNFLLSTEGNASSVQQQINQYEINPTWSWGNAHIGDFSENYTSLTYSGILVRGAGATINPGLFRLSVLGGFNSRPIAGVPGKSIKRYLYGGRIGIGESGGSHVDLTILKGRDDLSSFTAAPRDTIENADSTQVGTPSQSYQETPQENLVIGLAGAVDMLNNILKFEFEVNGSAFTRDITSSPVQSTEIPALFSSIYTARLSTTVDYAYTANLQARFDHVTFKGGYRYIGPGYNSLGVASMMTDQRQLLLGGSARFAGWSVALQWSRQNDNLIGQKLNTTVRQFFSGSTTVRPLSIWNATFVANVLSMRNYAGDENQLVDFVSTTLSTNQVVLISRQDILRSAGVSYTFQSSRDGNPLRSQNSAHSHTLRGTASMHASSDIAVSVTAGLVTSRFGTKGWETTQSLGVSPMWRPRGSSLSASVALTLSRNQTSLSIQTNLLAQYRFPAGLTATLSLRRTGFASEGGTLPDYQEYVAGLTVGYRF